MKSERILIDDISMSTIRTAVQDEFKLNIKRKCRTRPYVIARTIYFKLCKDFTKYPYDKIGQTLGKNHATVLHAVKNIFECWEFCQQTSASEKKHINKYKTIKERLEKNAKYIVRRSKSSRDYKKEAMYWKRKYFMLIFKNNKRSKVINCRNRYKQLTKNC